MSIVITFVVTSALCYAIFKRLLRIALTKQEIRLRKESQERFAKLIAEFNHEGPIPPATSTVGMVTLIISALDRVINNLLKLYENKDYNTTYPISELRLISQNELRYLVSTVHQWLYKRRQILTRYNDDQGASL